MGKGSTVFYHSIYTSIEVLTDDITRLNAAMGAVIRYAIKNEEYTGDDPVVKCAMLQAIPLIEADRGKTNRGGHGAPKGNQNARKQTYGQEKTNHRLEKTNHRLEKTNLCPIIDGDGDGDGDGRRLTKTETGDIDYGNGAKTQKRFAPPTLEEVQLFMSGYVSRRTKEGTHYNFDPTWAEDFMDFYGSKGWMVGKNKMKDWKLSASKWVRSQNEKQKAKNPPPFDPGHFDGEGDEHAYDNEAENW